MGELAVMDASGATREHRGEERRQFKRFPMRLVVQARRDDLAEHGVPAQDRPEQHLTLEISNFSLGGLRGVSATALRRDERLTLTMPPFGTRPQINVTGRVVRCQRDETHFDVGIEFGQTREEPESCPWIRLPDLFYMAGESSKDLQ